MKINEADLRSIIEEELKAFKNRKNVANSKHPSDVEPVEDPNANGILSAPTEHVPPDVPADVEKPQARVQDLTPIVKEHGYSLKSVLEEMRFVGGMGFGSPSPLSESEELDEGGCGSHKKKKVRGQVDSDEDKKKEHKSSLAKMRGQ